MRKLTTAALAAALAACGGGPRLPSSPKGDPVLEVRGAIQGAPIGLGAADLAALPKATVRGRDPVSGREGEFEGTSLAALVERVRPEKRAVLDTMVVRTRAGAAVPVPLTMVRQLKPVLARPEGGEPATLVAWPNLDQRGLDADPRAPGWWARDVVALEIVPWPQAFGPALAPPIGSGQPARVGAGLFGSRCLACHTLRGAGGTVGPELTRAADRLDPARFDAALEAHRFRSQGMAAPDEAQRAQLWAFLRAVARAPIPEPAPSPREERRRDREDEEPLPPPGPGGY